MDIPVHFPNVLRYSVSLFNGLTPRTGETLLQLRLIRLDDDTVYNFSTNAWAAVPTDWTNCQTPVAALDTNLANWYLASKDLTNGSTRWARGNYQAIIHQTATGEEWSQEFTVGLFQERRLGESVVYDGTNINLRLWMEEAGVFQPDYTQLANTQILDATGAVVLNIGTLTGSGGMFSYTHALTLSASTNYVLAANAVVPWAGSGTLSYAMRVGLVRP